MQRKCYIRPAHFRATTSSRSGDCRFNAELNTFASTDIRRSEDPGTLYRNIQLLFHAKSSPWTVDVNASTSRVLWASKCHRPRLLRFCKGHTQLTNPQQIYSYSRLISVLSRPLKSSHGCFAFCICSFTSHWLIKFIKMDQTCHGNYGLHCLANSSSLSLGPLQLAPSYLLYSAAELLNLGLTIDYAVTQFRR